MKRRLSLTALIVMMNQVLTPFSYAFEDGGDIFDVSENVAIESEISEDSTVETVEEVVEETTDEETTDEETTDEETADEETTDEEITDEETTDEEITDEETTDEETTDEETTDEETTDEETADEETTDEETIDEETADEETTDEETIDEETTDEETIDEETADEETTDEETTDEETTDDETTEEIIGGGSGSSSTDENISGEVSSGTAIEIIKDIVEENIADRIAEEIAQIWQSTNSSEIEEEEEYDGIKVRVSVPAQTIPSVAQVGIDSITDKKETKAIKKLLVKKTLVTNDTELYYFDIGFDYTLSNGEGIRIQPHEGKEVQISFDYTNNPDLSNTDNNENQKLLVYNLERLENYESINENDVEIQEVEIDKSETKNGELVFKMQENNLYVIVLQQDKQIEDTETAEISTGSEISDVVDETPNEIITEPDLNSCDEHYHLNDIRCEIDTHTITWKNEDGTIIDTTSVAYGEIPTHANASQPADVKYTYEFAGWTPEISEVKGDAEYTATYTYVPRKYTITWKNEDGTVIDTTSVAYGETPTHTNASQPADEKYTYTFKGRDKNLDTVTGPATYTATYTYVPRKYTITWKNEDGTINDTTSVEYGQIPTHKDGQQPADAHYTYEFAGWTPEIVVVTGDAEYRATYKYILNTYTITWVNDDGTILEKDESVEYGMTPTYDGETPMKEFTEEYTYEFVGWTPEISEVKGDAEYTAQYNAEKIQQLEENNEEENNEEENNEEENSDEENNDEENNEEENSEEENNEEENSEEENNEEENSDEENNEEENNEEENNEEENSDEENNEEENSDEENSDEENSDEENNDEENNDEENNDEENNEITHSYSSESIGLSEDSEGDEVIDEEEGFWGGIWNTLKTFFLEDEDGYLRGSETIDGIIVSVEAEEGTFPEGTEVVIKGVSQERLETIQTSLIEDESNNVTEDAQILAFDISFVYSGEEIQPLKEVSVKFNYKDNSDFQGSSMSELSVYHIDDDTDEGEEVEVVNKEGDEIEILATNFSTYAVVAQKGLRSTPVSGRGIMDQMPDFEFTGIVINRPDSISNGPVFYIIMDRNLGATSTDTNNTDSYGYMYQWGNNYGFPSTGTSLPSNQVASKEVVNVDLTEYGPAYDGDTQYYSEIFITAPGSLNANKRYDWATTGNNNIWGDSTDKDEARQGPCPSGWHVPSMTEWSGAMAYWKAGSGNGSLNNFTTYLKLPKAGSRARSSADLQKSGEGRFYSSTPKGNIAYALTFKTGNPTITEPNNRVDALSVRCFKNEITCEAGKHAEGYECVSNYMTGHCMTGDIENGDYTGYLDDIIIEWTGGAWNIPMCELVCDEGFHENDNMCIGGFVSVTFDLDGGRWYDGSIGNRDFPIEKGVDISNIRPNKDPYKNGHMFMGWFDESSNSAYRFKFQGTTLTGDLILTAHWAPFNDIVYTGIIDGNERMIVLMDRNMGATATGSLRGASQNSYGFYYQWGNNYGFYFDPGKNINTQSQVGAKVDASGYGPNTALGWYYGETFIRVDKPDYRDWSSATNDNLWGGGGDNATNDYDNRTSGKYTRQGPCPKGYHVPSLGEWRDLVRLFYNNNGLGELTQTWPNYVGTAGGSTNASMRDEPISVTNRDNFANTFYIPAAGRVQYSYVWERYGNIDSKPRAPVWASSVIHGDGALGFEVKFEGGYINIGGWNDERSQLKPVRCFKDLDDYTVTWKNYNGTVLETDDYVYQGATPTYNGLEDPIKDELSEFVGWYLEGDENQTIVDLSTQSVNSDRAYVAKFIPIASEDAYIVTVDIDPLSGGNVDKEPRYNSGDTVILTGTANSGYEFLGWFTGNNIVSLDNPYIFIADDSDGTGFTAVFSPLYSIYTGTNNELGGTISYEVSDITRQGKLIRFAATPAESFALDKWIVNGNDVATGGSTQLDMILSGNINLTGYFVQVANLPCNFNGETIPNGESVIGYQSDSVTCPNACVSQVATCNNGEWNVADFETEYSYSSCNYSGFTCSTIEYPLSSCPENGVCSSCTGYTVNENACVQETPIYKLDSCSGHYHVSGDVCEINTYEITWTYRNLSGDWVTNTGNYVWGSNFTPFVPTYPKTLQTKYTFIGWNPELSIVTENTGYTAIYSEEPRPYTITFVSSGENYGTVSQSSVTEGYGTQILINNDTITISGTTVTATATGADAQYTYTFSGWNNTCGDTITGDCTITAEFSTSVNEYLITFQNEDRTPLQTGMVAYGDTPVYTGATPQKAPSGIYAYVFNGWNPSIETVTGSATYTALYTKTARKYTIKWRNIDGTLLRTDSNVGQGAIPEYSGVTPTNGVSNQYFTNTFAGWNPEISAVQDDAEYFARYTYTVASGLVLDTSKNSVSVILNANGGEFSNNSGYNILNYNYYNRAEKEYSHSSNYSDDGIRNTRVQASDAGQYLTTITGAEYLYVNVTYDLQEILGGLISSNKDKLYVYAGTSTSDEQVGYFEGNGNDGILGNVDYVITGESVLLNFYLANRTLGYESNGFYAVIVGVIPVGYITDDNVEAPSREGYTFAGWYTQAEGGDAVNVENLSMSGNLEIFAHWNPISYSITYKDGDSVLSGLVPSTYTIEDNIATLPTPNKYGYVFSGWLESGSTITSISAGTYGDKVLMSEWKLDENHNGIADEQETRYTVTINYVYSTGGVAAPSYTTGDQLSGFTYDVVSPSIEYYTSDIAEVSGTITGNVEVTVTYRPVNDDNNNEIADEQEYHFTIEFTGGVHGILSGTTIYYDILTGLTISGAGIRLPEVIAESGYVFSGWNPVLDEDGVLIEGIYEAIYGEDKNNNGVNDDLEPKYTVTVNYEYSRGGSATGSYTTGGQLSGFTYNVDSPEIENYQANKTNVSGIITGNVVETVIYTPIHYTLTINLNGGTGEYPDFYTIESDDITLSNPIKTGYTFVGWTGSNGATAEKSIVIAAGSTGNKAYNAVWQIDYYDVLFADYDGSIVSSGSYNYGDIVVIPASPYRTGYDFTGWMPEVSIVTGDMTYTAVYDPKNDTPYTVKHFIEQLDGSYKLKETSIMYGTTDTNIKPETRHYSGFEAPDLESIYISADGLAELEYRYSRNTYDLIVKDRDDVILNTGVKFEATIPVPSDPIWTGNTFLGWIDLPVDGKMSADNLEIVAKWSGHMHTITFDTNGGSEITSITGYYGESLARPNDPTKTGYVFVGWEPDMPTSMPDMAMTIKAKWEKIGGLPDDGNNSGGNGGGSHGGGGGGGSTHWSSTEEETGGVNGDIDGQHGSADTGVVNNEIREGDEVLIAYEWAYANGITTLRGIENADPDGLIPRGHMAKMVVNFAENVLGVEIGETPFGCSWEDEESEWESEEIKYYAEKSCALGIMGINMVEFLPNKTLDRAEFGTILSRLLWGNRYNVIDTENRPYYVEHLEALRRAGIMTKVEEPELKAELRKWARVMFMRVDQLLNGEGIIYWSNAEDETNGENSDIDWEQHGVDEQIVEDTRTVEDTPVIDNGSEYNETYVDPEVLEAYSWAYANGITTLRGIEKADPDGLIPRGHMAKMVVNFAENVLGVEIGEIPFGCSWQDEESEWESEEIKYYAEKSCALGIMGINMVEFLPNKTLDRAEFGTILSRLLWGNRYNVIDTENRSYYVEHLQALKRAGIMTKIDNPEENQEQRKWAWLMLMRSRIEEREEKEEDKEE